MITERHVVACFLVSKGHLLLLRRSNQVGNYQGRWTGVSGSVRDEPLAQAFREIHEETGLLPSDVQLVRRGQAIEVDDVTRHMRWQVHPFLFRVEEPEAIQLSWEHSELRWIDPRHVSLYETVPMVNDALKRVWDPAELGPATGAMRSEDFVQHVVELPGISSAPGSIAGDSDFIVATPVRPASPEAAARALERQEAALEDDIATIPPLPAPDHRFALQSSGGRPFGGVAVPAASSAAAGLAWQRDDDAELEAPERITPLRASSRASEEVVGAATENDLAPAWYTRNTASSVARAVAMTGGHALTVPATARLQPSLLSDADALREARRHAAAVRVKVMRTGEFPSPQLEVPPLGHPPRAPGATGAALLDDPLLAPSLASIRDNRSHGAEVLIDQALQALRTAGERCVAPDSAAWLADIRRVAAHIAGLRPSMASIAHVAARVLHELEFAIERIDDRNGLRTALHRCVSRVQDQEQEVASQLATEISELIPAGSTIMTLGFNPHVVEGLQRCTHFGIRVIVPEGRPQYDGRLMARAVLALGKTATVITDAATGLHMREADLAIVGADGLLADGSVVARTGGYLMALAARAARVPLWVAAPLSRLDLRPDAPKQLVLEEKEADEVWTDHLPGLDVRNVYFERIPSELITGVVCEDGLIDPTGLDWEVKARDFLLGALHKPVEAA